MASEINITGFGKEIYEKLLFFIDNTTKTKGVTIYALLIGIFLSLIGILLKRISISLFLVSLCWYRFTIWTKKMHEYFSNVINDLSADSLLRKAIYSYIQYFFEKITPNTETGNEASKLLVSIVAFCIIFLVIFLMPKLIILVAFSILTFFNYGQIFDKNVFFTIKLDSPDNQWIFFISTTLILFILLFYLKDLIFAILFGYTGSILILANIDSAINSDYKFDIFVQDLLDNKLVFDTENKILCIAVAFMTLCVLWQSFIYYQRKK